MRLDKRGPIEGFDYVAVPRYSLGIAAGLAQVQRNCPLASFVLLRPLPC